MIYKTNMYRLNWSAPRFQGYVMLEGAKIYKTLTQHVKMFYLS